jgi:lipoprotein-releasing system permease protein
MSFERFIARRYIKAKRKQAFISLITVLSVGGVTVGVMALLVVIAVMAGAESSFKDRILGVTSHIVVMQYGEPVSDYQKFLGTISATPGVEAVSPFIYTQTILRSASGSSGVVLRGIDPETGGKVTPLLNNGILEKLSTPSPAKSTGHAIPGIIIGKELAGTLKVKTGDTIFMLSPRGISSSVLYAPSMERFQVMALLDTGMHEFDLTLAYIDLKQAQKILHMGNAVTGIEVRVKEIEQARAIKEEIVTKLGFPFWAKDWMQLYRNMLSALKLQKTVMFIILALIVLVAAFNIAGTLFMMVIEKTRDIAILKAMGATDKSIRKIFVLKGMTIGGIGTVTGLCFGFILCTILKHYHFIKLDPKIYPFTTLPVQIETVDVSIIALATLAICYLASIYPSHKAARLNPVDALKQG